MNKSSKKNWKGNELKKSLTIIVSKQKVPQISFFFSTKERSANRASFFNFIVVPWVQVFHEIKSDKLRMVAVYFRAVLCLVK